MKELSQRVQWQIITNKARDLKSESHLAVSKIYLIQELESCINNYRKEFDMDYDPANPPGEDNLNDDMGSVYF